jgi:xanthine dehydrogenase YagT iron-sulfur-binding subunit
MTIPAPESNQRPVITGDLTRREVVTGAIAFGSTLFMTEPGLTGSAGFAPEQHHSVPRHTSNVTLTVNGKAHHLQDIAVNTTLLDCLRDDLHLTGSKKGCGLGQCGACTVLVDELPVNACLALVIMQQGKSITTIEAVGTEQKLHPLQSAFIEHDAFQCGYCTPGQIISGLACIQQKHAQTDDQIREWMSGNLCRCGAYPNIVAAIRQVAALEGA